ncbi:hypothetical protein F3Y22_tig00111099pilonHSYRG00241 [Hibiscus syriacus]|uniref:GAT domain-containing protein n=1 Tax=Hibiscus syriacus TaxID=106335 RepID=A0A6A2Z1D6_HIBSY|nr:hypothetical protein F3Y22_tig00111099pilonHSYRG00241 [Hibiscus syriacus]
MDSDLIHDMDSDMILDLNYVLIFDISVYGRNMFYWGVSLEEDYLEAHRLCAQGLTCRLLGFVLRVLLFATGLYGSGEPIHFVKRIVPVQLSSSVREFFRCCLQSTDDLTESMLEKCKQSQLAIQMIIESTTDDDGTLFEALNLNDELQQVISKFEVLETSSKADTTAVIPTTPAETDIESTVDASPSNHNETKTIASPSTHSETQMNASRKAGGIEPDSDAKVSNENEESERV